MRCLILVSLVTGVLGSPVAGQRLADVAPTYVTPHAVTTPSPSLCTVHRVGSALVGALIGAVSAGAVFAVSHLDAGTSPNRGRQLSLFFAGGATLGGLWGWFGPGHNDTYLCS